MNKFALLFLLLTGSAGAFEYSFNKKIVAGDLKAQLLGAGITAEIKCVGTACTVYRASADPSAVVAAYVYVDPIKKADDNRIAAIALVKKLHASTATQAEKDELLGRLAFMLLGE